MKIKCTCDAYHLITGEKRFSKNRMYDAKLASDCIFALDNKEEWTIVSTLVETNNLLEDEVFKNHFELDEKEQERQFKTN